MFHEVRLRTYHHPGRWPYERPEYVGGCYMCMNYMTTYANYFTAVEFVKEIGPFKKLFK